MRLLAVVVLLVGLAFVQDPGFLVADTKFDLAVSPGHFLERALHLWDDEGAFGQLQNQAYGYLWPMGPFFVLFHALDVPGWIIQRLWQALVMSVAFLGTARVARALGMRSDAAIVAAGLAFALSPRMLTVLGPISIEAWPGALAPWVLLPLVRGSTAGSPRRAAAWSALAVAMVGGVNAAATFAVLPLGVIWVLTRTRGPRRRSLMTWWPLFTLLGTLWWLVPLFVMGAYSPPFLDYIETTSVTTFPTTLFDALRGTSNWVPYVSPESRAGNDLLITGYLALNSGLLLLAGFAGLIHPRNPHRLFLGLGVLVGLLMVTAGHQGSVQGLFSGTVGELLDGSLAPLRNVHKFDPVVRLPLVLGLGFLLERTLAARAAHSVGSDDLQHQLDRGNRLILVAVVVLGLLGASLPALRERLEPSNPVASVPGYWEDAARWLDRHGEGGTSLLAPGSGFASYLWGGPRDEPMQFLARSPWAVRNAIPLAPTGNIRMLDAIEDRFAQGLGSSGTASFLRRSGIGYLVVRNDLRPGSDVPDPVLVHQAIADSPGLTRVAGFGPVVGGEASLTRQRVRAVINGGWQTRYRAVEVFRVPDATSASSGGAPRIVAGGPEDLLDLEDLGVLGSEPAVLGSDVAGTRGLDVAGSSYVLTDGLQRRQRSFARIHDGYSAALTPGDDPRQLTPQRDYLHPGQDRWATTVRLEGARSISASSSGSDSDAAGGSRRGELPYAAVDGSGETEWVSDPAKEGRPWWRIGLDARTDVRRVAVTGGAQADDRQTVRVRTQNGVSRTVEAGPDERVTLDVPEGATSWIRVESPDNSHRLLSLADVDYGGSPVVRRLVLPTAPARWGNPSDVVLRADVDARSGCATVSGSVRCVPGRQRASEEPVGMARRFELDQGGDYVPQLTVRPRAGAALDSLVTRDQPVNVSASSTGTPDPRSSPLAAIDGDPATTWTAKVGDFRPSLLVNWIGTRRITGLALSTDPATAARRPTQVTLVWPGGRRTVSLDSRGRATFPAVRTSQMRIQVDEAEFATDLGFDGASDQIGVGIQELRLTGLPYLPSTLSTTEVDHGCGSGPTVRIDGVVHESAVTASPAQLFAGTSLPASVCAPTTGTRQSPSRTPVALRAGANDVDVTGSGTFDVVDLVLHDPSSVVAASTSQPASASTRSAVRKVVTPEPGAEVLDLGQNDNAGWHAHQGGEALSPVVLNGWQQGWFVRSDGPVTAEYGPDGTYRIGLGLGLLALLGLVLVLVVGAFRRPRRAEPEPLRGAELPLVAAVLLAVVAAALLAGWPGVGVAAVVVLLVRALDRRVPDVVPWLLAGCCFVAAWAYFLHPWADADGWAGDQAWPHYLVLVPVVGSVVLAGRGGRRFLSRIRGVSTRR